MHGGSKSLSLVTILQTHVERMNYVSVNGLSCRFGLNGRSLILQAAQRAAKKHKFSHSASQGSDSTELPAARPHNKQSTASNEESNLQPAASAGFVAGARSFQQDADAIAAPDTVHLAGQLTDQWKTNKVLSAPRRSDVLSSAATDALIDELEPHDQPLVAYINRSSVPRILRQVTCAPLMQG